VPLESTSPSRNERLFPTLTGAQVGRIAARGRRRSIARGDVLVEAGARAPSFFVVVSGALQVSDPNGTLIVTHLPGQFSGEATMITGRRTMARVHAVEPGK